MKLIIALAALVAVAIAAPPASVNERDAVVTRLDNDNIGVGSYRYGFETSNGISQQQEGEVHNAGTDHEAVAVHGRYAYVGPDGVTYDVQYVADEDGFRPQGAHVPH